MKTVLACFAAVLFFSQAFCQVLLAQWPAYRAPDAPRLADGSVNTLAPTPRTSDGKPDLSGIWDATPLAGGSAGIGGATGAPAPVFRNIASLIPGGTPLLPEAKRILDERLAKNSAGHPDSYCLPIHPVQLHSHPQPRKIVQTRTMVLIIYEANNGLRQIFLDGRKLPTNDPQPWWYGYSVGHWEGDTLVVETNGFRDDQWLDEAGTPMTSSGKMTERFRRTNFGTLEVNITLEDPKTFTRPVSFTITQRLMPDTELIEFVCAENEKSVRHFQ
jgi:hypothetical protein